MIDTEELLNRFTSESKRIIGDDLAGIYLHGSLAMDCFNPDRSDIDLIVVTGDVVDGLSSDRARDVAPIARLKARDGVLPA